MNIATYARRNLFRRRGRTILTLITIAVAVLIFNAIRTVDHAWKAGAEEASKDRLATRHKVSITMLLPKRYIDDMRDPSKVPGIKAATWANWFAAKDPRGRTQFFAGFAADHLTWFDVMDEMKVDVQEIRLAGRPVDDVAVPDLVGQRLRLGGHVGS